MDPKKKFWLFKKSQHFCSVPWNHVEIFTDGSVKTCSKGQAFGNLFDQNLSEIVQSSWIKDIKIAGAQDLPHDNCTDCYNLSDGQKHKDLRDHYNSLFKTIDIDYNDVSAFRLSGIDLHWDNTCNLKCIYCNPYQSSSIAQEQKIYIQRPKDQQLDQIVDLILENQWQFKEIYLSGGEPMLSKHNRRLLSSLENLDIPIRINSNITQVKPGHEFFESIRKFRNVLWTVSAEATGDRFEYIRHGSQWKEFTASLNLILDIGHSLRINSVWFIGSAVSIFPTLEYFIDNYNITDITINQLSNKTSMLVRNAPNLVKVQARQSLNALLDSGKIAQGSNSWYNIVRCNRELDQPIQDSQSYKNYLDSLDSLRSTDWRKIFTELDQ